ncbi:hypothetical protein, partial [Peptoniphilus sp. EMRHCC_23]|uniref:hypothetical protein n=2 Tax=Peptoniphilus rachelemmaiella TaxID=2811779 RepID=UPI001C0008E5
MYLQNLKIKSKGLLLIFCLTVACLTISTLMSSTKVHAASLKSSVTAEGMKDHGIEIEKAEFCKSKDRVDFGYKGIYGFVYLRLKGAPDGATYKIRLYNIHWGVTSLMDIFVQKDSTCFPNHLKLNHHKIIKGGKQVQNNITTLLLGIQDVEVTGVSEERRLITIDC